MCGGKPKSDNSGEVMRQQEEARQARISQGRSAIDQQFDGSFNQPFFDTYRQSYLDFYNPQADKQYNDTKEKLTFNLARSGNLQSSAGADKFGSLDERYGDQKVQLANQADNAVADLRGRVEQQRGDLYGINSSAADPSSAAARATMAAANLRTPPTFSPLGAVFADLLGSGTQTALLGAQARDPLREQGVLAQSLNGSGVRLVQ